MFKRLFLYLIICFSLYYISIVGTCAQSNWEAGIRYGDGISFDGTIPLATKPRLHLAAYLGNNYGWGFGIGGYLNWLFGISGDHTGLKFYPGLGGEMYFGEDFEVGIAGDFGLEYSFKFPLTIGVDWRPGIMISEKMDYYNSNNWGIIARFRIGEGNKVEE